MKYNISIVLAVVAIVFATAAVTNSFVRTPDTTIGEGTISGNELDENSVSTAHIIDGTIADEDISDSGISKIADESITLSDLTTEVLAGMSGIVEILDNSILGSKLANNSILNRHINDSASIDPAKIAGVAWTASNDGSGSGLDADTIDSFDSSNFLRNDMSGSINGDLTVTGNITHQEETRYYTIPSCAFVGNSHDTPYTHIGGLLINSDPAFDEHYYKAPVNLPSGAILKKVSVFYYMPDAIATAEVKLYKRDTSDEELLSITLVQTTSGAYPERIDQEIIETINSKYISYWLDAIIDTNDSIYDVQLLWICLEYSVTSSLP